MELLKGEIQHLKTSRETGKGPVVSGCPIIKHIFVTAVWTNKDGRTGRLGFSVIHGIPQFQLISVST